MRRLSEDGVTVLLTTQYLEEADQLAYDLVVLDRGGDRRRDRGRAEVPRRRRRADVPAEAPQEAALVAAIVASDTGGEATVAPSGEASWRRATGALRRIEERLAVAGVAVAEIGLRLPSLDDVFLSLTGHDAEKNHRPRCRMTTTLAPRHSRTEPAPQPVERRLPSTLRHGASLARRGSSRPSTPRRR